QRRPRRRQRSRSRTCAGRPRNASTWRACSHGTSSTRLSNGRRDRDPMTGRTYVSAEINGEQRDFLCEPRQSLLEVLRDELGMTGSKEGCNNGNCGACTVILNGRPVNSCCVLGVEAEG